MESGQSYTYFVSYNHGPGFGSTEIRRDDPIANWEDILSLTDEVAERVQRVAPHREISTNDIVILNWTLLNGPKGE